MKWLGLLALLSVGLLGTAGCGGSSSSSNSGSSDANNVTMSPANGATLPNATIGATYSQTFAVSAGGTAPYTFVPGTTPSGLTFTTLTSSSGSLAGVPTQNGRDSFSLQIIDANSQVTQVSYVISVVDSLGGTMTISPASLTAPTFGSAYAATLSVSTGTSPYTWSVSQGSLPPGISLGSSTTSSVPLSGTPTQRGSFTFTVEVTDSSSPSQSGFIAYTLNVQ